MAFLRKQTSDGISIGVCYSIFQKCVRRCLVPQTLYYGKLIHDCGSPNALRKRLVQSCIEDMCRWDLAVECAKAPDQDLFRLAEIVAKNKKTHISAYIARIGLAYAISRKDVNRDVLLHYMSPDQLTTVVECFTYEKEKDWGSIRTTLDVDGRFLYSFMDKGCLVWICSILFKCRPELRYPLDRNCTSPDPCRFDPLPEWALDKHVSGGTPGYSFFFKNGLEMSNMVYESEDLLKSRCLEIYHEEEKDYGKKARTKHTMERWRHEEENKHKDEGNEEKDTDFNPKRQKVSGTSYVKSSSKSKSSRSSLPRDDAAVGTSCDSRRYASPLPEFLSQKGSPIQVQLLTRRGQPKVYFATDRGKPYVYKGPLDMKFKDNIIHTERLKQVLELPQLDVDFEDYKGEIWMRCNRIGASAMSDLTNSIMKESKLESKRPIYNGPPSYLTVLPSEKSSMLEFVKAVFLKIVVGTNDLAMRNFLRDEGGKIYSIDDHANSVPPPISTVCPRLKKDEKAKYFRFLSENEEEVDAILHSWCKKISSHISPSLRDHYITRINKIIERKQQEQQE